MVKIKGGYYIKARKIQESEIAHAPPHVREIWDWLLMEANHCSVRLDGKTIERGQLIRSYKDIREGLSWYVGWRKQSYSKWNCETAMKWLMKRRMVTTKKLTRGLLINICNYDYYQDPVNYESDNENHKKTTRKPQSTDTRNKNEKNEKNIRKKEYSSRFLEFMKIYPNKTRKKPAWEVWKRIEKKIPNNLIELLKAQIANKKQLKREGKFTPEFASPDRYLKHFRWEDELQKTEQEEQQDEWRKFREGLRQDGKMV